MSFPGDSTYTSPEGEGQNIAGSISVHIALGDYDDAAAGDDIPPAPMEPSSNRGGVSTSVSTSTGTSTSTSQAIGITTATGADPLQDFVRPLQDWLLSEPTDAELPVVQDNHMDNQTRVQSPEEAAQDQSPPPPPPVRVLYEFVAGADNELSVEKDEIVLLLENDLGGSGWTLVRNQWGRQGWIPTTHYTLYTAGEDTSL
ncbi:hypothetical protein B0H63DRAFT_105602 [Podospora didyma]|uniref:SH3 domain-containing protein n=1 Tax=Podospora didyma TaxID=330526 RepID=A0AAE0U450_9PEZI|nr:hypothetical protein B0H63DRAFT_105602 [Podospora didyma]